MREPSRVDLQCQPAWVVSLLSCKALWPSRMETLFRPRFLALLYVSCCLVLFCFDSRFLGIVSFCFLLLSWSLQLLLAYLEPSSIPHRPRVVIRGCCFTCIDASALSISNFSFLTGTLIANSVTPVLALFLDDTAMSNLA
jgi:hypothetical protein